MVYLDAEYYDVRNEVKKLCSKLNIDVEHLPLRPFTDFGGEDVPEKMQNIRYSHYNTRRMKLLDILHAKLTHQPVSSLDAS